MLINKSWNSYDLPSKYLGTYELEVQNLIIQSQKKNKKKYFINLGCGEGYHAICLMKKKVFQRFIGLVITGHDKKKLEKEAIKFKNFIENFVEGKVLGPVDAPIFRLRKRFRLRLLIRGKKTIKMQNSLAKIIKKFKFLKGIKLTVDVDPISFN